MSRFPNRQLNQRCIYWGAPISDGYGVFTWGDPIEIDCRWEDTVTLVTTALGEEKVSKSVIQVKQDLEENGMLLLGEIADLDSGHFNDPVAAEAKAIIRFDKTPTVKGDKFLRRAYL